MVTPLQIDAYTRDQWQEFDALAIAQIAPLAYSDCYRPRLYIGLDKAEWLVDGAGAPQFGMHIQPGSLICGVYVGANFTASPSWMMQVTDESMGLDFFSDPISQAFLSNQKGRNYPYLFSAPRPVVGDGLFTVSLWNQLNTPQLIVPVFGVLEVI